MNLAQLYSLTSGQKIKNINILEKFYPLNLDKFILLHPYSKQSKCYSYWQDAIEILHPILKEAGLPIIQVGTSSEPLLPNCIDLRGKTTVNQVAYLTSKATLCILCDSFVSHLAGHYDVPRVILISNNYSACVSPFFGSPSKQIILEPDRIKKKPTFSLDEGSNKQIDEIKPEAIAESVLKLLNLPFDYPYETVYVGANYTNKIIETVPNAVTNIANLGVDSVVIRLDYEFNEEILQYQMQHAPVTIVTDRPINTEILKIYKPQIKQLFYIITKDHNPGFAQSVIKLGVPLVMFSYLSEDELNEFKLQFLDIGLIQSKEIKTKNQIPEISEIPTEKLFYKSNKITLSKGGIFPSYAAWKTGKVISNVNEVSPVIETTEWFRELEHFVVLKQKD